ncbi:MAG: HD domain-containing protein [Lachnospiraceae bacterium]|nr:HD domain-containing protein [Lachnospiraceae bacterium]
MLPTREEAEKLVIDAEQCNPGPWGDHSRVAALCAEKIAALCEDMDAEKAYILGLLHDIGRRFGVKHLGHVYDGYKYMTDLGYDEVARICLTHSFSIPDISVYIGNFDVSEEGLEVIKKGLTGMVYDEYDKLIQLCDCLASAGGVVDMAERMEDVRRRYGSYPQEKWDANMALLKYFGDKVGRDIYQVVE